jgi:hypothetical protein
MGSSLDSVGFSQVRILWFLSGSDSLAFLRFGFFGFSQVRILWLFSGSDLLRASTIQRCKPFQAFHKLFDREGKTFDFRE